MPVNSYILSVYTWKGYIYITSKLLEKAQYCCLGICKCSPLNSTIKNCQIDKEYLLNSLKNTLHNFGQNSYNLQVYGWTYYELDIIGALYFKLSIFFLEFNILMFQLLSKYTLATCL